MYRRQSLAKVLEIEDPATPIMLNDDLIFAMEIALAIDDLTAVKDPLFASLDRDDSGHVSRDTWVAFSTQWHESGKSLTEFLTTIGEANPRAHVVTAVAKPGELTDPASGEVGGDFSSYVFVASLGVPWLDTGARKSDGAGGHSNTVPCNGKEGTAHQPVRFQGRTSPNRLHRQLQS